MNLIKTSLFIFFLHFTTFSYCQINQPNSDLLLEKKILKTTKTTDIIKIDGVLNEPIWNQLDAAKDFTMFDPGSGNPEPVNKKTKIKVTYTEEAIYIGAYLFDDNIKSIPMEILGRDNFGQADYLFVSLNPNNDGLNDLAFIVFSTGSQADAKVINGNEDFSWNAVWESSVKINDDGDRKSVV